MHGFGLKSVRRVCDKYDATLDIAPDKGFFNVNILMPIQETEEKIVEDADLNIKKEVVETIEKESEKTEE